MNSKFRQKFINSHKNKDIPFIYKDSSRREYFKFEDNKLVEYDLTMFKYNKITLTSEEKNAVKEFFKNA